MSPDAQGRRQSAAWAILDRYFLPPTLTATLRSRASTAYSASCCRRLRGVEFQRSLELPSPYTTGILAFVVLPHGARKVTVCLHSDHFPLSGQLLPLCAMVTKHRSA
eukprot:m.188003 g.188003  ORF g.188003 m.188003 type:complete len:107 (+) comp53591_c0_seq1:326-646(+)